MLSRFLPKSSHIRFLSNLYSKHPSIPLPPRISNPYFIIRPFSNNHGNGNNNKGGDKSAPTTWKLTGEDNDDDDDHFDDFFAVDSKDSGGTGISDSPRREERSWLEEEGGEEGGCVFERADGVYKPRAAGHGDSEWLREEGGDELGGVFGIADEAVYRPRADSEWLKSEGEKKWNLEEGEESKIDDIFDIGGIREVASASEDWIGSNVSEEQRNLEREEKELTAVVKGQNRAFGDLVAASGITDDMLDSLIALKNFEGIDGLPPLSEIEDMRYEKNTRKSARAEIERQKQEEVAKARVRQVDEKGRAYGTGRRKCSIARVWIQPGEGKFLVNDKQFDVYFPMLDHRAALLRPFSETKTLGLWDVDCTVKGGGVSGQVGAIQLGISRALQNWEPDLRPPLKTSGFLTRDPRVVERKKPGKAKARKSFQWVKR